MDKALWRWVHEEEDEEGDVSTTDERIIESIANMLLERPYVSLPTTSSTHIVQKYVKCEASSIQRYVYKSEFPM